MGYYILVDNGASNIRVAIGDESILTTRQFVVGPLKEKTDKENGPIGVSQQIIRLMNQCISKADLTLDNITSGSISAAGTIDDLFGGSLKDPTNIKFPMDIDLKKLPENYTWKGEPLLRIEDGERHIYVPLVGPLKAALKGKEVFLGNDVNIATIGIVVAGEGRNYGDFSAPDYTAVGTTHGTGFGGGVWTRGGIMWGVDKSAAEVGHFKVVNNGRKCNCGHYGCAETYASGTGVENNVQDKLKKNGFKSEIYERAVRLSLADGITKKQLSEDPALAFSKIGAELAFQVHKENPKDKVAKEVVKEAAKYIGRAYGMIAVAYNPYFIGTFGSVTKNWGLMEKDILQELRESCNVRVPDIFVTSLGDNVGLYGAAGMAMGYGK